MPCERGWFFYTETSWEKKKGGAETEREGGREREVEEGRKEGRSVGRSVGQPARRMEEDSYTESFGQPE